VELELRGPRYKGMVGWERMIIGVVLLGGGARDGENVGEFREWGIRIHSHWTL
jgi:hypothetical protein